MTTAVAALSPLQTASAAGSDDTSGSDTGIDGFSFHDFLSIVNPLQHFPVVSTIYRAVTGDAIKPFERIAGDTLYGGLWGFVSSVANVAFQDITGKDFGDTAIAMLKGDDDSSPTADLAANATLGNTTVATAESDLASGISVLASANATSATSPTASASVAPAVAAPAVATAAPRPLQGPLSTAATANANSGAGAALLAAMNQKGIDPALSRRAFSAYQKSLAAQPAPMATSAAGTPTS